MKVKDLISKVDLQDSRIKILEEKLKGMMDVLEKQAEDDASHLSWEARFDALRYIKDDLKKRLEVLERAHPTICKGPTDYEHWPPEEGIPHEHEEDSK